MVNVSKKRVVALMVAMVGVLGMSGPALAAPESQRFVLVIVGEDDPGRVIAVGPITGVGTFEEIDETTVAFVFPEGRLVLDVPNDEEDENFNERTCSGSFRFSGNFTVLSEESSGAFEGATGSGTFRGSGRFFGVPTAEGCSEEEGFFTLVVRAQGQIDLAGDAAA